MESKLPQTFKAGAIDNKLKLLRNGSTRQRQRAAASISSSEKPDSRLISAMCAALKDKDPVVREFIISGLRELGPRAYIAIPALRQTLQNCNIFEARNVLYALAAIGPAAIEALPELLIYSKSDDDRCRYLCINLIGALEPSIQEILELLKTSMNDGNYDVRTRALRIYHNLQETG